MSEAKQLISLRVHPVQLEEIDRRAAEMRLSRTEYMVRCALGDILDRSGAEKRLDRLEERLGRVEEMMFST